MGTRSGTTPAATASYIASMLGELRSMSNQMDADFLAYLLEMAMQEATTLSNDRGDGFPRSVHTDATSLARLYMTGELD